MEGYYRFAGHDFLIMSVYSYFAEFAQDYRISGSYDYELIETSLDEIKRWAQIHREEGYPLEYLETLVIHSKIADKLAKENVFIFHGSTIYCDNTNNCYIFTAPSGTGKSTHINILRKVYGDRINYINDDKPFIGIEDDEYFVYGSPWNGKGRLDNNIKGKLRAVFVVNRGTNNKVEPLSSKDAIIRLIQQIHLPLGLDNTQAGSDFLFNLVSDVPTYLLTVNMEDDAARTSMNIMNFLNEEEDDDL